MGNVVRLNYQTNENVVHTASKRLITGVPAFAITKVEGSTSGDSFDLSDLYEVEFPSASLCQPLGNETTMDPAFGDGGLEALVFTSSTEGEEAYGYQCQIPGDGLDQENDSINLWLNIDLGGEVPDSAPIWQEQTDLGSNGEDVDLDGDGIADPLELVKFTRSGLDGGALDGGDLTIMGSSYISSCQLEILLVEGGELLQTSYGGDVEDCETLMRTLTVHWPSGDEGLGGRTAERVAPQLSAEGQPDCHSSPSSSAWTDEASYQ